MRQSTCDTACVSPRLHCSTLLLEGATIFQAPSEPYPPGPQRQPLQKHNKLQDGPDNSVRNGSSFKRCMSGTLKHAAMWDSPDRCAMSAVGCGRSSQDCQSPMPSRGVSTHLAAWHKQNFLPTTSTMAADKTLPLPRRQLSTSSHPAELTNASGIGSQSGQAATSKLAVRMFPQDRHASWDSQKGLAFTPPASLTSVHTTRRVSQGLPGGSGKLMQPDDSALRLPPLTPPAAEVTAPPAPSPLPTGSTTPFTSGSASPIPFRSASSLSVGLSINLAAAQVNSSQGAAAAATAGKPSASLPPHKPSGQESVMLKGSQPLLYKARSAAVSNPVCNSLNNGAACCGQEQADNKLTAGQMQQVDKQQQPFGKAHANGALVQQQRHASTAGDDTGQVGPPITRMRPAPVLVNSSSAAKKSGTTGQAAADSLQSATETILLDALLCGWEQQSNDGDLYPLTFALEKEGDEGADLHKLQFAAHVQSVGRTASAPVPSGPPLRSKAGKSRPHRRWQQE